MAKIGQFAIAKFDGRRRVEGDRAVSYNERLCLVTGRSSDGRELEFIHWETKGGRTTIVAGSLPRGRISPVGGLDLALLQNEFDHGGNRWLVMCSPTRA